MSNDPSDTESLPPDLVREAVLQKIGPYKILETLGEGAMGTVYLAERTKPMHQQVALKIIKLGMDTKQVVARFEVERQALAMMNHPHVARVFDGGATPEGRPYFVMELVRGIPITEYCDKHRLSTTERLKLFQQVCEAVQHAHQKGIIHRDLKPSNIMVTVQDDQPAVKVIDFGVAKATERHLTERTLFTEQGQLIGTPAYMSPEQAEMTGLDIDTRTDIYSLGVLLYELLVGALPFESEKLRAAGLIEIHRIIREEEPPRPSTRFSSLGGQSTTIAQRRRADVRQLASQLRGDLDWITMKAMDKDRTRRYATATEFSTDLSRHLRHELVVASPPSTIYRFSKFLRRNKGPVAGVGAVIVALAIGLSATTVMYARAAAAREEADQARIAEEEQRKLAEQRYEEIIRLADLKRLADAKAAADDLWPALPEKIEAMETWLESKAAPLRENLSKHEATLASLRDQALEYDLGQQRHDRETHPKAVELAELKQRLSKFQKELDDALTEDGENAEAKAKKVEELRNTVTEMEGVISELEQAVKERRTWRLPDDQTQWQHDTLAGLVQGLGEFVDPDPKKGTIASVEERLDFARTVEYKSVAGREATAKWAEAIADIARLEVYGGLQIKPQLGLLPLCRNLESGLWEFWHTQSGTKPEPTLDDEDVNPWALREDTGLVLVLIPGGTFRMGAQKENPEGHNYDPQAESNESPVHDVTLAPFFISKYEMTQGQWRRFAGGNPSLYGPGFNADGGVIHDARHPVENFSWEECTAVARRLGLLLPTEAQWEYGARAGTSTVWWSGNEVKTIQGAGNICDQFAHKFISAWTHEEDLDDGYVVHAPVGSFSANGFGLHDTIGNVWEWCRDRYGSYDANVEPGDGLREVTGGRDRVGRGGSFNTPAAYTRSADRYDFAPGVRDHSIGVRPARVITD